MWALILHNLKKARGSFLSFGLVMLVTGFILNTGLVLLFQNEKAYNKALEEYNTAQLSLVLPEQDLDALKNQIESTDGVLDTQSQKALFATAELQDFQDSTFTMNTFFYPLDVQRDLNKVEILEQTSSSKGLSIYLPLYLSRLGGFETGDTATYKIDGKEYSFYVEGIVSEMQYGNYGTGFIGVFLPEETYNRLKEDPVFMPVEDILIETDSETDLAAVKNTISSELRDDNIVSISFQDVESTRQSRTMIASAIVLILSAFAALVLLVSLFLSRFKIRNTIDEEISEMGVLKAMGFTSTQLMLSQIIPYFIVSAIGLAAGIGLSYLVLPLLADVLGVQSGFVFVPGWDTAASLIPFLVVEILVLLFSWLAARRIRPMEPINAIRGINTQKPEAKNRFALDSAKGPISWNLTLKQSTQSGSRNILLAAVTIAMMLLLSFSSVLTYNVIAKPDNFLMTLSEELPDIQVVSNPGSLQDLEEVLEEEGIRYTEYGLGNVMVNGGSLPVIVAEDFSMLENDILYEGRHPVNENEIAIGSALTDEHALGDVFVLESDDNKETYTITGYIQSVNHNGTLVELTNGGYEKLSGNALNSLALYLGAKEDPAAVIEDLEKNHGDLILMITNVAQQSESMQVLYASLIAVVAVLLFGITLLIVFLVLYVILKEMITSLKTDFGIYKAVGFTSRQLMVRNAGSLVPVILISALLACLLAWWLMPVLFNGIFSMIGAIKNHFVQPWLLLLVLALLFTLSAAVISILLSRPIKRITAYSLLKE